MLADTDYVGIGVVITSIGGALAAVIAAWAATRTHTIATATNDAVTTSNGKTIAELVETNQARNVAQDIRERNTP